MVIKTNFGTRQATEANMGLVKFATDDEVIAGVSVNTAVNPKGIKTAIDSLSGTIYDVILLSTNWVGTSAPYTYTINSITGITSDSNLHTLLSDNITIDQIKAFQRALIVDGGLDTDTIIFKALGVKPTVNIPIRIVISSSVYVESNYEIDDLPEANTTTSGIIKIAEISDVEAGTDNTKAITSLLLLKNKANGVVGLDSSMLINESFIPTTIARTASPTFSGIISGAFNGNLTGNVTGNITGSSGSCTGNSATATSAEKLTNTRTVSLTGDVTGSGTFDGTSDLSITATIADDSHNHTIANITNLQTELNLRAPIESPIFIGLITGNVSGNVSGSSGSCTGNAATATKLATTRQINGVDFDGSIDITVPSHSAISKNKSGYIKLQGSDLIIQWGQSSTVPADSYLIINFPISFPTACFSCIGNIVSTTQHNSSSGATVIGDINRFSFRYTNGADVSGPVTYIAIGY